MFEHFPSIESFHRVRTDVNAYHEVYGIKLAPITYRGKVKLHGTNSGILVRPDGTVLAQSRSRIITPAEDNMGFATWVEANKSVFSEINRDVPVIIYGEWCGRGIQKGVAISAIDKAIFTVFAIQFGTSESDDSSVYVDPDIIGDILADVYLPDNVYILPWEGNAVTVDFFDDNSLRLAVDFMNAEVERVEKHDPFVQNVFGVEGTGEGLVYYPVSCEVTNSALPRDRFRRYTFKAKGEKHKVVKTKKAVQIDPEVAASIDAFVDQVATEARMEQAVTEGAKGKIDKKMLGPIIAWFSKDVKKDVDNGEVVLPDGVEWKLVAKALTSRIQKWYIAKVETI